MIVQEPVQAAIWHCLNHYNYSNAVFLAERLHAEVKTEDSLFLLATSYYRNQQVEHAYHLLKDRAANTPQCRYLLGICAFELEKYSEAESVLLQNCIQTNCLDDVIPEFGEQASFVLLLLAKIALKTERKTRAIEALKKSLKLNPFLWTAYESLCKLGEKPNPKSIFNLADHETMTMCNGSTLSNVESVFINCTPNQQDIQIVTPSAPQILSTFETNNTPNLYTPEDRSRANQLCLSGFGVLPTTKFKSLKLKLSDTSLVSPSFGLLDTSEICSTPNIVTQSTLSEANEQKSLAKRMRAQVGQLISRKDILQNNKPLFSHTSNVTNLISVTPSTPQPISPGQNVRRSSRLFSNSYSVKENSKSPTRNKFATPKSPSRKTKQRLAKVNLNKNATFSELNARNKLEKSETVTSEEVRLNSNCTAKAAQMQKQSAEGLMLLLRDLGQAYLHFSQFECKRAVEELQNLSPHQFQTIWVYNLLGLAYFEMADYESSVKYFSEIHQREPYRLQSMDVYSTALWHLQKEVALSSLAQDLVQLNKRSPVTWCVNGNCFSLHKEHDTAIKFFHRAVQVDADFPYAYTLLGHEYIMTEELDKAMSCFRNAIRLDPRHYNAWFGVGTIYAKQERYHLAEINYMRALSINCHSSVIMCHIGMVQHALKETEKALKTFNAAIERDPKNPLCKFHRSSIYFAVGRHSEALKELEELKAIVPKESLVYYLMGKVHKKLGNTDLALMHFSWATDLDPKGANSQIKEAFDPGKPVVESPATPAAQLLPRSLAFDSEDSF